MYDVHHSFIAWLVAFLDLVSILLCSPGGAICLVLLLLAPGVAATPCTMPFPDISIHDFADFIQSSFSSNISLSTVLVLLFSLTKNPELLNLHGRQQHAKFPKESSQKVTPWLKIFSRLLLGKRLVAQRDELFQSSEAVIFSADEALPAYPVSLLSTKLDRMIELLDLNAFRWDGSLRHRRKAVSYEALEPVHLLYPQAYQCETVS